MSPGKRRHPRGALKETIREYLAGLNGDPASIAEITAAIEPKIGTPVPSSVRTTLQDDRYFVRVSRGVFRIKGDSE
ncbi:hypothetical protein Q3O43_30145 (plasmid) [Rhodococcus aetherivorans]|uniref:hypothetical protein n=1 Tax=Rhodococcus TaxID=1827 RepID=UPI0015963A6A|nr:MULTISPECIES: hypothetical protein [Rhodococcus]WKX02144.1 hypothetical protein Q3O43_30145 [Rhodococcus aetherivorans]